MDEFGIVILAAGQGTRLKLPVPKPLAPIAGRTLIDFSIKAGLQFLKDTSRKGKISLVLGHQKELLVDHVSKYWKSSEIETAVQVEQKGTADALRAYFNDNNHAKNRAYTIVLCADTPLITASEIKSLVSILESEKLDAVAATFIENQPRGYGRIERGSTGFRIVEEKDATEVQKKISEVNSGLYILRTDFVMKYLFDLKSNNNSKEFYLTDLFQMDRKVKAITFENKDSFVGVNTIEQLQYVNQELRNKIVRKAIQKGVYILAPEQTWIDDTVELEQGVKIYPGCILEGNTKVESGTVLEAGVVLKNTQIAKNSKILAYSYLESAVIGEEASVGPFARLREGSVIGRGSKIGNFVETKKVNLGEEVKVSHLSYVGDAEIGDRTNIGCGFITCNYDGASKHITKIGSDSFIGSDSQMIAPISIGNNCYVASGSTINQDLEDGDFAIARGKQVTKKGMAKRFIKSKK